MGSKRKLKEKVDGKRPGVGESLEKEKCKTSLEGQLEMQGGCRGASGDKKEQRGSSPTQKRRIFREEVTRAGGSSRRTEPKEQMCIYDDLLNCLCNVVEMP